MIEMNIPSISHEELSRMLAKFSGMSSFVYSFDEDIFWNLLLGIILCAGALTMNKGRQHMCPRGPCIPIRGDR